MNKELLTTNLTNHTNKDKKRLPCIREDSCYSWFLSCDERI
jgi:hypothetical protein